MGPIIRFFEDRLGLVTTWRQSMTDKRPPQGIGFLRTIGFCALIVCLLQVMSGIALALHYVPSVEHAYDSIRVLEREIPLGAFTRSLHHFGASAMVILVGLHMLRVFATGAYKRPRELTWLTGIGLLLVVLGFGFTGYLLPWDQKAYFATVVGTEIAGKAPMVGAMVKEVLNGGDAVGPPTLTRFYVIHVVLLPAALGGLILVHLALIQRHGVAAPGRPVGDEGTPGPAYFPHHVLKEAIAGLLVTGILFALAATVRAPLTALAEPGESGFDPRPDWYFLGLFELLKITKGPWEIVGTFWIPNLLLVALALLPFVDRNPERHWRRRPIAMALGAVVVLAAVGLTAKGALDLPENPPTLRHPIGLSHTEREGYLLVRRLKCTECHAYTDPATEITIGGSEDHEDAPYLDELGQEIEDVMAILEAPEEVLGDETEMPDYAHVPAAQRRAIAVYLLTLQQ